MKIFDPRSWENSTSESANNITLEFTRVVIAIGVFAVGVELPKEYIYRHWKSLFFLIVPVTTWVRSAPYVLSVKADSLSPLGLVRIGCPHLRIHPEPQLPFIFSHCCLSHPD